MIKVAIQYVVVYDVHEIQHKWLGLKNIFYFSTIFSSRVFIFLSIFDFSHTFTVPLSFISLYIYVYVRGSGVAEEVKKHS